MSPLLNQLIASFTQRIRHPPWNSKYLPSLVQSQLCSNKRTAFFPGLHQDDRVRKAADDPVPHGKISGTRRLPYRKLRKDSSLFFHSFKKSVVLWRIALIDSASQHSKGRLPCLQSASVSCSVNSCSQTADNLNTFCSQGFGKGFRNLLSIRRTASGPYNSHRRLII